MFEKKTIEDTNTFMCVYVIEWSELYIHYILFFWLLLYMITRYIVNALTFFRKVFKKYKNTEEEQRACDIFKGYKKERERKSENGKSSKEENRRKNLSFVVFQTNIRPKKIPNTTNEFASMCIELTID